MADSSFEDQVRKELEQLRLKPDGQVWANVDAALREGKKRRWLFWFVFAGIILLGGGTYLVMQHDMNRPISAEHSNQDPVLGHSGEENKRSASPVTPGATRDSIVVTPEEISNKSTQDISRSNINNDHRTIYNVSIKHKPGSAAHEVVTDNKMQQSRPDISSEEESATNLTKSKQNDTVTRSLATIDLDRLFRCSLVGSPATIPMQLPERKDTLKKPSDDGQVTDNKSVKVSKWKWYISVDGGKSGYRDKLFASQNGALNFANAANPANGSSGGLMNSGRAPSYHDAFSIGASAQALRKINTRSAFGISAGYALYRTRIDVGKRLDTLLSFSSVDHTNANGFVYRPTDTSSRPYTNNYHFITFNLDYYRYFRISTTDLRWRLGIGAAIVAGSNALHYDNNSGFLFQNNILIPGIQWNFSTGFDVGLIKERFFIGPQLVYFLTPSSTMPSSKPHFLDLALRFSMRLKKENK